jgi:hypothetical protein
MVSRPSRRILGWVTARSAGFAWHHVADPRVVTRCCWGLSTILSVVVVGLLAGCRSVADLELLTASMSTASRRLLGLGKGVSDTTVRRVIVALVPEQLRWVLHAQIRSFHRQKALQPEGLRFGVVSMDGKVTSTRSWDGVYAQQQGARGAIRTVTACLISSPGRPCLDAHPIPAATNEMGAYLPALSALVAAYKGLDLFRVVMYDAGACSEANARGTRALGLQYVMQLTDGQPTLLAEAKRLLALAPASVIECGPKSCRVRYTLRITEDMAAFLAWDHLKTVVHVHRDTIRPDGSVVSGGDRYFVSSLAMIALNPAGWATLIRARWGVENNCHHTFDTAFDEDDRLWFDSDPTGALNIILLRRLAYNAMTLLQARTLRGETTRMMPWKALMRWLNNVLIAATEAEVHGMRARAPPLA